MAVTITKYNQLSLLLANGAIDLDAAVIKLALIDSGYVFDAAHTLFATPAANEIVGTGYVAGGATLTGQVLALTAGQTVLDADDVVWTALTATCRAAVLYASGTIGGVVDPVLAYILLDDTPADVVISGIDYSIVWDATGIIALG